MKKIIALSLAATTLFACNKGSETTESGIEYKILSHEEGSKLADPKDMMLVNLRMSTESNDSLLMETFTENSPRYIPIEEPTLKDLFVLLSKGDSVEFFVNADTLFQKSFGTPTPAGFKAGERVKFVIKIVDLFSQQELERKSMEQLQSFIQKDSLMLADYTSNIANLKKTASGLMYVVEKEGTGKKVEKGNTVKMLYKGYFMTGETFDENSNRDKPFEFAAGLGQVIPGWDEAVQLMKEGGKYKLIVPWQLGYGERGMGPITPCTSLVFDVELLKVN